MPPGERCFCGRGRSGAARPRFAPAAAARGGEHAARLLVCDACGVLFLDAPEEEQAPGGYAFTRPVAALRRLLARRRAAGLARLAPPGGRALDVGAGDGALVAALADRGLEATGIDARAIDARARPGADEAAARVRHGRLADLGEEGEPYDLVVLWHALEHLREPYTDLRRAAARMRPGAALVVATPNAGSWQARLAGPRWLHLDLPHHRALFTPRTLAELVRDAGFEVERLSTGQLEMDLAGMLDALGGAVGLPPRLGFDALGPGAAPGRRLAGLAAIALLMPFALAACAAARVAGAAGTLRLVARRRDGGGAAG